MIENVTGSAVGLVSQKPIDKCRQVIEDLTLADAPCNRIHHIELKGRREGGPEEEPE